MVAAGTNEAPTQAWGTAGKDIDVFVVAFAVVEVAALFLEPVVSPHLTSRFFLLRLDLALSLAPESLGPDRLWERLVVEGRNHGTNTNHFHPLWVLQTPSTSNIRKRISLHCRPLVFLPT